MRTPFLLEERVGATEVLGASITGSGALWRTALKAGELERNSSSAPGKLALRVIGRLLGQLVHGLNVGMN